MHLCLCLVDTLTSLNSLDLDGRDIYIWKVTTGASMIVVGAVPQGYVSPGRYVFSLHNHRTGTA